MRRVLLCMLEAVGGGLCLLDVLEVVEVMRCVLLCIPEAVEGGLCLLEVCGDAGGAEGAGDDALCTTLYAGRLYLPEVLEVMRRVLLCLPEVMRCATLYGGGCGGCALFVGGCGGDAPCAALYAGGSGG